MVLLLKQWKSRSSPGFAGGVISRTHSQFLKSRCRHRPSGGFCFFRATAPKRELRKAERPPGPPDKAGGSQAGKCQRRRLRSNESVAGWSSPVARQAHNLKVVGSNPTPATTLMELSIVEGPPLSGGPFAFVANTIKRAAEATTSP